MIVSKDFGVRQIHRFEVRKQKIEEEPYPPPGLNRVKNQNIKGIIQ